MEKKIIIRIGLLAVLALIILVCGLSFLKGEHLFKTENTYVAVYDRLDGLAESNAVLLSGYKIGSVQSIDFKEVDNELKIFVKLKISNDFKIPKGTVVKIVSVDIMGTKGVDVFRPKQFDSYCQDGDTLMTDVEVGLLDQVSQLILPMKDNLLSLLSTSDSVMHTLNVLLDEKSCHDLQTTLSDLRIVSDHLVSNVDYLDNMILDFNKIGNSVSKNSDNIDRAINNFASLSDSLSALNLSATLSDAQVALRKMNRLLSTVNDNNGTVQKLLTSDSIYNSLQQMTGELNTILDEFQKHPKKYINLSVFGGKDKSYQDDNKSSKN